MDQSVREFDVIVVGGGPAGENVAQYAVQGREATAALVEAELLGGECSYYACMPSKAMLRPLDVAAAAAHLQGVSTPRIEPAGLLARRDVWVSTYDDSGQVRWAQGAGLEVVRGRGRLAGERQVDVTGPDGTGQRLRAREAVVLATGSVPVVPPRFAGLHPWSSRDATGVTEIPRTLAIVGGGVVACEAARWMSALGTRVTMLVRDDRVLSRTEPFASDFVVDGLREAGVDVRLATDVKGARRVQGNDTGLGRIHGGPVTLTLTDDVLVVDEVLIATGRRPATDDLGLETVGIADLRGDLPSWLYAVGDVTGVAPLTHWGKYQGRRVGAEIGARAQGGDPSRRPDGPVPQVVFTDPQVAWVGPTSEQAGDGVRVLDAEYTSAAGAGLLRDDARGRARLVVRQSDDVVVGATFVGADVAELLHSATVAIAGGLDLATLRTAVPSYPTASEVWLRLLE